MFEIGDKVFDLHINQVGTVSNIYSAETETYPISVDFPNTVCTYTPRGKYNLKTGDRHIKKVADIAGTVKVSPTHIYLMLLSENYLLPLALTSFKIVNYIIIATCNGKEYIVYVDNIEQNIEQILNQTKKESL